MGVLADLGELQFDHMGCCCLETRWS